MKTVYIIIGAIIGAIFVVAKLSDILDFLPEKTIRNMYILAGVMAVAFVAFITVTAGNSNAL